MYRNALYATLVWCGIVAVSASAQAESRLALVIGQSGYRTVTALPNPANDAKAMSQLLGDYKGRVFPALAAYDAGGGNVARWLQRYGDDPDLLVEQIPFAETQTYLRSVYDNYVHYQLLYRN